MRNNSNNKVTKLFVVAAISVGAFVACTDNGDKTADRSPSTVATDTSGAANGTSGYASKDSASKDAAAAKTTTAKRKGRTTIIMPGDNNDKMMMDNEGVYNKAQVMPQFPGGQDALVTYVNNHVEYPQQAIDDNATGTVRISFVVDENGKVQHAKVLGNQKVGKGLDEEALRIVNNMPNWKPGTVKGKNVKTRLELPINFQLEA